MAREKIAKPKKFKQVHQNEHYHPRSLARKIVHNKLAFSEMYGMNKVKPGATQSMFATHWRNEADVFARDV